MVDSEQHKQIVEYGQHLRAAREALRLAASPTKKDAWQALIHLQEAQEAIGKATFILEFIWQSD